MFGKNWRAQKKAGGHETCFGLTKPIVPDWLADIDQATTSTSTAGTHSWETFCNLKHSKKLVLCIENLLKIYTYLLSYEFRFLSERSRLNWR